MTEQMYDEKEVFVSESEGVYTIDIWVTEIREKLIFDIIMMLVLWPVWIIAAVVFLLIMPKAYLVITGSGVVLSFLLIVPIALMIRKKAKKYHREYEFQRIVVPVELRENSVYMAGKKVKIKYNFEEEGFDIYTGILKGYSVDGGITEEFRTFLENKGIPYR